MILKNFVMLALLYGALFLGAHAFEFLAFRISGIQASDLDPETYRTPDPDPATNFYSVLEYDFSSSSKDNYSPRGLHDYYPIPGVHGRSSDGNFLPWPWNPDFSLFFDLQTTANDCLERMNQGGSTHPGKMPDPQVIASAKTPQEICTAFIDPFRPFCEKLYTGLEKPESLNPTPNPEVFSFDPAEISVIDLIRVSKLLSLESLLGLSREPPMMMVKPILVNLRLAQGLFNRPTGCIGHIGGLAIFNITCPVIWQSCEELLLGTDEGARIYEELEKISPQQNLIAAVMLDSALFYQMLNLRISKVRGLQEFGMYLVYKPVYAFLRGIVILETYQILQENEKKTVFIKTEPGFLKKKFPAIFFSSRTTDIYNDTQKTNIFLGLTRLDLALVIFKNMNGKLPESLDQLVPSICKELPLDPFSGKNFGYKKTGPDTYILYSCWVDQKDDGGTPLQIPNLPPEHVYQFLFHEVKGDLVWPQHNAGKN